MSTLYEIDSHGSFLVVSDVFNADSQGSFNIHGVNTSLLFKASFRQEAYPLPKYTRTGTEGSYVYTLDSQGTYIKSTEDPRIFVLTTEDPSLGNYKSYQQVLSENGVDFAQD
jgi:hypothetical protein